MASGYKKDGTFAGKVFQKGHTPFFKGTKGIAKPNKTSFKKGHKFGNRFKKGHKFWLGKKRLNVSKENHYRWKKGISKSNGRIFISLPNHPFCNKVGYIRQSRLVMEKHLGRYLTPEEVVHHINRITNDDRIENLKLFPNKNKHSQFHRLNHNLKWLNE